MRRSRPVLRFVLLSLVYFIGFMSIAPATFYPAAFRAFANAFLPRLGSNRIAKYERLEDLRGTYDTKISVGTDSGGSPVYLSSLPINSVREGYAPTALLLALFFSTPVPWRRRWRAAAIGFAVVQGFVALRITVAVLYGFSRVGVGGQRLFDAGAFGSRVLHRADQILTGDLHFTYIAPVVIWLLVATRFAEVRALWLREPSRSPAG